MIPAYFWKASHAPGGMVSKLPTYDELTSAVEAAARHYARWLYDPDPLQMCVIEACDLEKDWAYAPTGHKAFDEQRKRSSGISAGNVSSNVQTSMFVRARSNTSCNNLEFAAGELHGVDMGVVGQWKFDGVALAKRWLQEESLDNTDTIIYAFHHYRDERDSSGARVPVVHGWALTDTAGKLLHSVQLNPTQKSAVIMENAIKAITMARINSVELLRIEDGKVRHVSDEVRALLDPATRELSDQAEALTEAVAEDSSVERPRGG